MTLNNDITFDELKSKKYLLKLALPIFVQVLFNMLIGMIDQFMIKSQSQTGYVAVGNANQIINVLIIFLRVVATASTILISQYIGAKKTENLKVFYTVSVWLNAFISILLSAVLLIFPEQILSAIKTDARLVPEALIYIRIIGGGLILEGILNTYFAFFLANGKSRECMYISVIENIINICMNAVLLYGWFGMPKMGIKGVAIASIISKTVGVIIVYQFKKKFNIQTSVRLLKKFPFPLVKKIFAVGLPTILENFSYDVAMIFVQTAVNQINYTAIETKTIVSMFTFIAFIGAIAVSNASQVIAGRFKGAGKENEIGKICRNSCIIAVIFSICGAILYYFISDTLCSIFTDSTQVLALCKQIIFLDIFLETGRAVNLVIIRILQGCGDVRFPVFAGIIFNWTVAVGGSFLFVYGFNMGLKGVWIAMAADECTRAVCYILRFLSGRWKKYNLISDA